MERTQLSIDMDFRKATRQVGKLREIASNLERLVNKDMADCIAGIGKNWKGDSAERYIKKGNTVKGNIRDVVKNLREVAVAMEEIAVNTKKAEEQALDIVKNKNH